MIRSRLVAPAVLRALVLGSAAPLALVAVAASTVGCADENQPETWVKRLDDPVRRPEAIKRLEQFFEDAMTRANKDRNDPSVKALLDKTIGPLTKMYADGKLDERTRIELIKHLADTRDARAKDALIAACKGFTSGASSEDDLRWAAPAIGALKLEDAAPALGEAFVKLQAGTQKGSQAYKNVSEAMLALKSPSWKGMLLERINRPMERVVAGASPDKITAFQNEQFWQVTAAQLLGELKDAAAVKPLLKVVMSPGKADVAATASMALVKIGKPAVPELVAALKGEDKDIVEYAAGQSGGSADEAKAYVRTAAVVLGAMGHPDAAGPMIAALEGMDSDVNRAVVARELTKLPVSPDLEKAFQTAFEKIAPTTLIPPGNNARAQLLESVARFYDASQVPWVLKQVKDAKGGDNEKGVVKTAGLVAAIKLMNKSQIADVKAAVEKDGTELEKQALGVASEVVTACGDQASCYLAKIQEPAAQQEKTQFAGIKAAYMLGMLGDASTATQIAAALPKIRNAAVRFAAVAAVDRLTPKDGAPVADALQKIVDENKAKDDRNMMQADAPVREIIFRLRAR